MTFPERDINYQVEGLPPSIKGKITEFADACRSYAFKGSYDTYHAAEVEEAFHVARYDLERTIATHLEKAKGKAV